LSNFTTLGPELLIVVVAHKPHKDGGFHYHVGILKNNGTIFSIAKQEKKIVGNTKVYKMRFKY
jgi:hypothetical protein